MRTFTADVFLAIVDRMQHGAIGDSPDTGHPLVDCRGSFPLLPRAAKDLYLNAVALALPIIALLVSVLAEVPIVEQIVTWTVSTLPANRQRLRVIVGSNSISFE